MHIDLSMYLIRSKVIFQKKQMKSDILVIMITKNKFTKFIWITH